MHKIKCLAILLFVSCACYSQVKFKNTGTSKISIAICYYDNNNGWTSKGWFAFEPNEEKAVYNFNILSNPDFYYCASIENCDKGYFGQTSLSVDARNSFIIAHADKLQTVANSTIKKYGFVKVNLKGKSAITIELNPVNLICNGMLQGEWTFQLDKEGEYAEKKQDAVYYRKITFADNKPIGWCKDFYNDGKLKGEFKLFSFKPSLYEGKCTWYKQDGSIEKEAFYKNGSLVNEKTTTQDGTSLNKQSKLQVVELPIQNFYINSTSNETWKGGSSKTAFYVTLPENTIEWYYEFTASRNQEETKQNQSQFSTASKLTSLIDKTGLLAGALGLLTAPPGGNICDVYILDGKDFTSFKNGKTFNYHSEVSRSNYKSGIVQVKNMRIPNPVIGVRNNDGYYGIHVSIQVVAIVSKIE